MASDLNVEGWARLCALIDDDPELSAAVLGAEDGNRWAALIDGLDDAGALAYLDVADSGVEVADALAGVPRVFRAGVDLDEVGDAEQLEAAIVRAENLLAPYGLRIVYLAEDSDAYPLVVVPSANVDEILTLIATTGREARAFS